MDSLTPGRGEQVLLSTTHITWQCIFCFSFFFLILIYCATSAHLPLYWLLQLLPLSCYQLSSGQNSLHTSDSGFPTHSGGIPWIENPFPTVMGRKVRDKRKSLNKMKKEKSHTTMFMNNRFKYRLCPTFVGYERGFPSCRRGFLSGEFSLDRKYNPRLTDGALTDHLHAGPGQNLVFCSN